MVSESLKKDRKRAPNIQGGLAFLGKGEKEEKEKKRKKDRRLDHLYHIVY